MMIGIGIGESFPQGEKRNLLGRIKVTTLLGHSNKKIATLPEYQTTLPEIGKVVSESWAWHGTGRYQYRPDDQSKTRDVLQTIIDEDGLIPHRDALDFTQGEMQSISTSPAWLYSLMYSQWHYETGKTLFDKGRNGLIYSYYLAPMAWRMLVEAHIHKDPNYMQMMDRSTRKAFMKLAGGFHDKYTKTRSTPMDMVKGGQSDISGNYPMLIGIKKGAFEPRPIARALDKHEMRSSTPIYMKDFTHILVPEDKVAEVTTILKTHGKNVPVYPIEWEIEYSRTLPLKKVLNGI